MDVSRWEIGGKEAEDVNGETTSWAGVEAQKCGTALQNCRAVHVEQAV